MKAKDRFPMQVKSLPIADCQEIRIRNIDTMRKYYQGEAMDAPAELFEYPVVSLNAFNDVIWVNVLEPNVEAYPF